MPTTISVCLTQQTSHSRLHNLGGTGPAFSTRILMTTLREKLETRLSFQAMVASCCAILSAIALRQFHYHVTLEADEAFAAALLSVSVTALGWVGGLLRQRRRSLQGRADALNKNSTDELPDCSLYDDALAPRWSLPLLCSSLLRDIDVAAPITKSTSEPVECVICLADVDCGDDARQLPCKHSLHASCADLWLVEARRNSCPTCSAVVVSTRDSEMRTR